MTHGSFLHYTTHCYRIQNTTNNCVFRDVIGVQNQNDSQKLNKSQWKQTRDSKFIINDL